MPTTIIIKNVDNAIVFILLIFIDLYSQLYCID